MTDLAFSRPGHRIRGLVAVAGMAAVLCASLPINLMFAGRAGEGGDAASAFVDDWLRGGRTAAFTRLYNDRFVLRDVGIDVFGTLSYVLFGEGRPGVLVGDDGWLYSAEEFQSDAGSAARVDAGLDRVAAVRDRLGEAGIRLVVAIVPAKARVYPEHLGGYRWPAEPASRAGRIAARLAADGVPFVDLAEALVAAKPDAQVFLRTDTHWTPAGAEAAAGAVAKRLGEMPDTGPAADFRLETGPTEAYRGDLMRYVRLGPIGDLVGPRPDDLVTVTAEGGGGDLLGEEEIPVALVGTSYSADRRWGFEAFLKAALHRDVLNLAEEGEGPFRPMEAFLAGEVLADGPPKVVIWEIPERYLDDPEPAPAEGGR